VFFSEHSVSDRKAKTPSLLPTNKQRNITQIFQQRIQSLKTAKACLQNVFMLCLLGFLCSTAPRMRKTIKTIIQT